MFLRRFFLASILTLVLGLTGWLMYSLPHQEARAAGNTYYVATTGRDSNPGTPSAPFRTIAKGTSVMAGGDTLYIRSGTYREGVKDPPSGTALPAYPLTTGATLIAGYPGDPPLSVILEPSGYPALLTITNQSNPTQYIVFDNLVLDGSGTTSRNADPVSFGLANMTHLRLSNSEVVNSVGNGITVGVYPFEHTAGQVDGYHEFINVKVHHIGFVQPCANPTNGPCAHGYYVRSSHNLIKGGEVYDTTEYGIQLYSEGNTDHVSYNRIDGVKVHDTGATLIGGGMTINSGHDNVIVNNLVYNNRGAGIVSYAWGPANNLFANNTIIRSDYAGLAVAGSGHIIRNNIVYSNNTADIDTTNHFGFGTNSSLTIDHNLCTNATNCNYSSAGAASVTGTPLFVNASTDDYHLQSTSPAKDAGTTVSQVTSDLDGVSRPQGPAYDIGAYEVAVAASGPKTYYVSTTSSDSNSCAQVTNISGPKLPGAGHGGWRLMSKSGPCGARATLARPLPASSGWSGAQCFATSTRPHFRNVRRGAIGGGVC